MTEQSLEKLYSFIMTERRAVSASELVRTVLKLENAAAPIADNIIQSLIKKDPRFIRTPDGRWKISSATVRQKSDWVLCKIYPPSSDWRMITEIHCARLNDAAIIETLYFSRDDLGQDSALHLFDFISDTPIILDGIGNQLSTLCQYIAYHTGRYISNPIFTLTNILKLFFPRHVCSSESDISKLLNQSSFVEAVGSISFEEFMQQTFKILEMLREKGVHTVEELIGFYSAPKHTVDFNSLRIDSDFLNNTPESPGVYIMRNKQHDVIYVGKAANLKRRLKSYFAESFYVDKKMQAIRQRLDDIEFITTGSELEALLLEFNMIKKLQPQINSQRKVHSRAFLERQRFQQIVLLPAVEENKVVLLLFNPSHTRKLLLASKRCLESKIKDEIATAFFSHSSGDVDEDKEEEEIITSWLSKNHERISRIDMRMVPAIEEALRLIRLHLENFSELEKSDQI